jgi:AraC-like DNA-binding protein
MAREGIDMEDRDAAVRITPADVLAGPAIAWYPAGAGYGPRRLADFELVWLLGGSARWEAAGRPAQRLAPGQVLLAPPGVVDRFRWDENGSTRHGYVHFRVPGHDGHGWPLVRTMTPEDPLDGLLRYLLWLAGGAGPASRDRVADVLALVVDVFVRGPWPVTDDSGAWPPAMAALADAVAQAWAGGMRPVTLDELATATGFSRGHLSRSFRARYGWGIVAGLERLRLERAEVLLRRSDLAVARIARLCGYPDPLHFSRRFRAVHGRPPRDFRGPGAPSAPDDIGALRLFASRVAGRTR